MDDAGPHARCDAHCHLDFAADPRSLAREAGVQGCALLSSTVTPEGFDRAQTLLSPIEFPLVRVGLGLHPWWVSDDARQAQGQADAFLERLPQAVFVGEVGLDFSARRKETAECQRSVFERIARACAQVDQGILLSIHAVRSAASVYGILERADAFSRCRCVLHWFSGSPDELTSFRDAGCWFSVGERMLASKRGRAYVQAIPADRLLLETDLPAQDEGAFAFSDLAASLERAFDGVRALRGEEVALKAVSAASLNLF